MIYRDKNGTEIKEGMTIIFEDGASELVYSCMTGEQEPDLGINASNEEYMKNHDLSEMDREYYPLSAFNLDEVEIVEPIQSYEMKSIH